MKKNKLKIEKNISEEVNIVKKLIVILIVVILFIVGFYFITDKMVKKQTEESNPVEINYDNITVGTILNRPYDEYLVLLYSSEESESTYYGTLLTNYNKDKKLYFVDLSLNANKKYVGEKSSGKFIDVNDAKFSGPTLLVIKNGIVEKFLETKDDIKNALK